MRSRFLTLWALAFVAVIALSFAPTAHVSHASVSGVVISAMYGGGGDTGSTYTHDYIEIFNAGTSSVNIAGWSIQYRHNDGTSWQKTGPLAGSLLPGQYFLARQNTGGGTGTALPTPDATGAANMRRLGEFMVVLLSTNTTLGDADTNPPTGPLAASIVDLFGGGDATTTLPTAFEGAVRTGILDATTAWFRLDNGCQDTNNNLNDFASGAVFPNARNSLTTLAPCAGTADVTVSITDSPDPVVATNPVTYTATVNSSGTADATSTVLTVDLSGTANPGTVSAISQGACSFTAPTLTCNIGTLAMAASFVVTFDVTPTVAGSIIANAAVSAAAPETASNNTDSETTVVNAVVTDADVTVSITDLPDPIEVGEAVTYTATVSNIGGTGATSTLLEVDLSGASSVGAVVSNISQGVCLYAAPTLTCTIGALASSANFVVTFDVTPSVDGIITADATVSATAPETAGNNTDSESTTVNVAVADPGSFTLVSPAEGEIVRLNSVIFSWTESTGATTYDVSLSYLSTNTRIGETWNLTVNAVDACNLSVCSVPSDDLVPAGLEQGTYSWTVIASADTDVEASDGPNIFTVVLDGIELVANGGFEDGSNFWTLSPKPNRAKVKCGSFGAGSDCMLLLKPGAVAKQNGVMAGILANTDTAAGDVLLVSAMVHSNRADSNPVLTVKVKYATLTAGVNNNGKDKVKLTVAEVTAGFQPFSTTLTLDDAIVSGKVNVKYKTASGKLRVDDVSVQLTPFGVPRASGAEAPAAAGALPLPAAPDAFRGNN